MEQPKQQHVEALLKIRDANENLPRGKRNALCHPEVAHYGWGLCHSCWNFIQYHFAIQIPLTGESFTQKDIERFHAKILPVTESGCWLWIGHGSRYGQFNIGGRLIQAHIASYLMVRGAIPAGLLVLHHCDVMACVNPEHLFLGTQVDNMQDCVSKGRAKNCQLRWRMKQSRFTTEEILEIRSSKSTTRELADRFGVSYGNMWDIRKGKRHAWA